MGLDMYLSAKRYIWDKEGEGIDINGVDIPAPLKLNELGCRAAYWRKANQIHGWFVENVQGGEDNCRPFDVTREDLEALIDACRKVLANRELAEELLPPDEGFFFGGYEYDEYYFDELTRTADELGVLLEALDDSWSFEYQASW
jgi:hypothetical protein